VRLVGITEFLIFARSGGADEHRTDSNGGNRIPHGPTPEAATKNVMDGL
jgi:hypothetical protein